jgi:hypothetical protein
MNQSKGMNSHPVLSCPIDLLYFVLLLVLAVLSPVLSQHKALVSGTVVERESQVQLSSVNLVISQTSIGATTDSLGHFSLGELPFGDYLIISRRVGYKSAQHLVSVRESTAVRLRIEMEQEPVALDPVSVSEARRELKKMLERQGKRVVMAEEIERAGYHNLSDVINTYVPGVMSSERRLKPPSRPKFAIYLNGTLVKYFPGELDYIVEVGTIDFVEIYRGVGMSPSLDRGSNERIISIHTKKPGIDR